MIEYVYKESIVYKLHPLTKLAFAATIMILAMIFTSPVFLLAIFALVIITSMIGSILKESVVYLLTMGIFAFIVFILQCLLLNKGEVYFTIFPSSWPMVGGWLPISKGGVIFGMSMALRVLVIVSVFPMIIISTQPKDIVMSLVEKLKVPFDYAFMFTTTLRFIPIILSEVSTIYQAQLSRAHAVEGWNPIKKLKAFAPIVFPIIFIAIEKADRLGLSMELRGYKSGKRTYLKKLRFSIIDEGAFLLMLVLVGLSIYMRVNSIGRIQI